MGTDCAPFVANLLLLYYERKFIESLKDDEIENYNFTKNIGRFIDDLLVFNDKGLFDKAIQTIYPVELQLVPTHLVNNRVNFLDMTLVVDNRKIKTYLYDKRNDFGFKVVSMPHFYSNTPNNSLIGTFVSQLARYVDINSEYDKFLGDSVALKHKLIHQGYPAKLLNKGIHNFLAKNSYKICTKYWVCPDAESICNL